MGKVAACKIDPLPTFFKDGRKLEEDDVHIKYISVNLSNSDLSFGQRVLHFARSAAMHNRGQTFPRAQQSTKAHQ